MSNRKRNATLESVVERANAFFRNSVPDYASERNAVRTLITDVLLSAGCYKGFRYLTQADMPHPDWKPGIEFDDSPAHAHVYPDNTRISFY